MGTQIDLKDEYNKFMRMIMNFENFAFMRNADGELAIMEGRVVSAQEGNWSSPAYVSNLGKAIKESLTLNAENIYYAVSCPCCDRRAYYWYLQNIVNVKNITFANLWININFNRFQKDFLKINRDAIVIVNYRANKVPIGNLNILDYYLISDDCISFWENEAKEMLNEIKEEYGNRNNLLVVVSAGPMSGPIIAELYKYNPNNTYVDFGSSIDIYYREGITRPYMIPGNIYAERNCKMYHPEYFIENREELLQTYDNRIKKMQENFEDLFLQKVPIYIYGNGKIAREVIKKLEESNKRITGIVTTITDENEVGRIDINTLNNMSGMKNVILALDEKWHEEIRENLADSVKIFPEKDAEYDYQDFLAYYT